MIDSRTFIVSLLTLCAVAAVCGPARASSRQFTRRDGQALCLATALITASLLLRHYAPENTDSYLILGGLLAPPLVAAVAGRRFMLNGFSTVTVFQP